MSEEPEEFEVLPTSEMQQKHGMNAESYQPIRIDPSKVPADLRDLIPWAERFGIGCDVTRHDIGRRTSQKDKDALSDALRGRHARIEAWLNSLLPEDGSDRTWTEVEAAFSHMWMFEIEENDGPLGAGPPDWYVQKNNQQREERLEAMKRDRFLREANGPPCPQCGKPLRTPKAMQCFQCGWSGRK